MRHKTYCCLVLLILVLYMSFIKAKADSRKTGRRRHFRHLRRSTTRRSDPLKQTPYSNLNQKKSNSTEEESSTINEISVTLNSASHTQSNLTDITEELEPSSPPVIVTDQKNTEAKAFRNTTNNSTPKMVNVYTETESKTTRSENTQRERKYKTVKIKSGKIKGGVTEIEPGKKVFSFLGIPYGQSPTGERRFKPPIKVQPWHNTTRNTLEYGNSCIQWRDMSFENYKKGFKGTAMWNTNTPVSEDCLHLNVWTPRIKSSRSHKMAVMVWIYGGGFYSGTSSLDVYDGKWLAAYEEVVVVSMNYRVGALGFLSLDHPEIPGNAGLLDQQLALKWVKENIHKFNGDPNNVTLFGESAGAVSIALHMMSEGSQGLFRNVILQSASALSPWSILDKEEAKRRAVKLASLFECSNMTDDNDSSTDGMTEEERKEWNQINCLRSADPQHLVDVEMAMEAYGIARFPNAAVVDGNFLKVSPHEALTETLWNKDVNVLAGFNANEGNYFIVYSSVLNYDLNDTNKIDNEIFKAGISEALRSTINFEDSSREAQEVLAKSSHFIYTGGYRPLPVNFGLSDSKNIRLVPGGEKFSLHNDKRTQIEENIRAQTFYRDRLDDMVGDINFVCPTLAFLDKILERQNSLNVSQTQTFLYKFVYRSSQNPWPEWMGVMHGYEIEFAFGIPLNKSLGYDELERNVSRSVMKMWSTFAKHGNPNYGDGSINWPPYNQKSKHMYVIGEFEEDLHSRSSLYSGKYSSQLTHCSFWREYFPDVQNRLAGLDDQNCQCPTVKGSTANGSESFRISLSFLYILMVLSLLKNVG